jgi:hypothetical protein
MEWNDNTKHNELLIKFSKNMSITIFNNHIHLIIFIIRAFSYESLTVCILSLKLTFERILSNIEVSNLIPPFMPIIFILNRSECVYCDQSSASFFCSMLDSRVKRTSYSRQYLKPRIIRYIAAEIGSQLRFVCC